MFFRTVGRRTLNQRSGFQSPKRFFCGSNDSNLYVYGDHADYKIAIPLPQSGTRIFSLSERQKVSTFLRSLQIEDPELKAVTIKDVDSGALIAGSTRTEELLQHDWILQLNDKTLHIKSPPLAKEGRIRVTQAHPKFPQIVSFLEEKAKEGPTLKVGEFQKHLEDIGVSAPTPDAILETLSQLGYVLHLDNNIEYDQIIFLHPQTITKSLDSMLDLPSVERSTGEKLALLDKLRAEVKPLDELYHQCIASADRSAHVIATTGFVALCAQFLVFARLTWWESDWDVMEPITWFTTVLESIILGKFYFLWGGSEFAHFDLRQALFRWRLQSCQEKTGFDPIKYRELNAKIADLEAEVQFHPKL